MSIKSGTVESAIECLFEPPIQVIDSIRLIDRFLEKKIDDFVNRADGEDTQEVVIPEDSP